MTENNRKHLILIDGHSLAYRMHFALENTRMKTAAHMPTWAVYGFFNAIFSLLQKVKPDAIAVSFDVGKLTFRNELYPEYKANRQSMPDELRQQMDQIRRGVSLLGIPIYEKPGFEADDVIGTLSERAAKEGWLVNILTGDQDSFQLIQSETDEAAGRVEILIPSRSPRDGLKTFTRKEVFEKWGVYPEQVIDYKGLRGDTSDNIPGVPGVGEKTAAKLLAEYPDLDTLYQNLDKLPKNKLLEKLQQFKDQAFLSRQLATIDKQVPLDVNFEDCHLIIPDWKALLKFLEECEFRGFIRQAPTLLAPFVSGESDQNMRDHINGNHDAHHETAQKTALSAFEIRLENQNIESEVALAEPVPQSAGLEKAAEDFKPDHTVIITEEQLSQLIAELKKNGVFALDLETTGLDSITTQMVGIAISTCSGFERFDRKAVNILGLKDYPEQFSALKLTDPSSPLDRSRITTAYIPVGHQQGDQLPLNQVLEALAPLLVSESAVKIVHNAKFELNVFKTHGIHLGGLVFDTMIASYVQNPDNRHGLKYLGFQHFQIQMQEIKSLIGSGKNEITFEKVPIEQASPYAASDSYVTLLLADRFLRTLNAENWTLFYEIELPLACVLAQVERTGVALDVEYLKSLSHTLDERISVLVSEIYTLVGSEFNLNSPKQLGDILFNRLGINPGRKTKGKTGFSTDAKVLESLSGEHPVIDKMLEYRQLFKLKSTYIDALPQLINPKTLRLHTSFNQTIAATGRLSSNNPNLQNIPIRTELGSQIRAAFVPEQRSGWQLLSADYSQIELRLLAHFSEDPNLIAAFQAGEDIHAATAALVFGLPIERVNKEMRYKAKAVNFGVIYGQTAHGLSEQLKIPRAEAAEFIDRYFFKYKRVKEYIESVKAEARRTGEVKTICGRVRDLKEGLNSSVRSIREFSERAAFNTPLQGSAADLIKVAMIRIQQKLLKEKTQSKMILQVHDELVLEVPDQESEQVSQWVQWAMALDQPLRVPLVIDVHLGQSWRES